METWGNHPHGTELMEQYSISRSTPAGNMALVNDGYLHGKVKGNYCKQPDRADEFVKPDEFFGRMDSKKIPHYSQ